MAKKCDYNDNQGEGNGGKHSQQRIPLVFIVSPIHSERMNG